ncbi:MULTISPECIES: GIY-YIG nuclease family protein [Crocosphaera]|nr:MULTISPECIES: GIY-YIG nuclease family protein [Crocosphaera]MCH2246875.1 GIY-YIG nuclease family protein [Crocosphaera sp.]NQZ65260.1 GIY-YIG nuclease family protein [Crocosphaera sp.]
MDKSLKLPSQSGTYCLVFSCSISLPVTIGKLGTYQIKPGYYCYIGSAFGPGGIKSRINRHLQINKRKHWHLDYLRPYLITIEILYSTHLFYYQVQPELNIFLDKCVMNSGLVSINL